MNNINNLIAKGYEELEKENVLQACDLWLQAWGELGNFISNMKVTSIEELEENFEEGIESLSNWVQDLEMELENAGFEDNKFFLKRRIYVKEFYDNLYESDEFIIMSMKLAEAESYFELGDVEKSEYLFSSVAKEYDKSIWPFLKWGDVYWLSFILRSRRELINIDNALEIYKRGLGIDPDFEYVLRDRINDLEKINKK